MKIENWKNKFLRISENISEGKNTQEVTFISHESRLSHNENDGKWLEIEWGLFCKPISNLGEPEPFSYLRPKY